MSWAHMGQTRIWLINNKQWAFNNNERPKAAITSPNKLQGRLTVFILRYHDKIVQKSHRNVRTALLYVRGYTCTILIYCIIACLAIPYTHTNTPHAERPTNRHSILRKSPQIQTRHITHIPHTCTYRTHHTDRGYTIPCPHALCPNIKGIASITMREIDPSHVKESSFTRWWWIQKATCSFRMFERSCLRQRRLFTFVRHASREVSCEMLTKVCRARINYLNLSCFLHYPHTVWSHIFTGCSHGGKVTFGNTLCTFNSPPLSWLYSKLQK